LDFENCGVDLHLSKIAEVMVKWETLAPALGLTPVEISDIEQNNITGLKKPLQRLVQSFVPSWVAKLQRNDQSE